MCRSPDSVKKRRQNRNTKGIVFLPDLERGDQLAFDMDGSIGLLKNVDLDLTLVVGRLDVPEYSNTELFRVL